jgi:hypothetical protein
MKQIQINHVVISVPDELYGKVHRVGVDCEIMRLPDVRPPRTVLDVGCGPGHFLALAAIGYDGPWSIGYDAHPHLAEIALDNSPPGTRIVNAAVSSTEIGEAHVIARGDTIRKVPIVHPRDLPPAECVRLNIGGREREFIRHYPHWAGVSILYVEWHEELRRLTGGADDDGSIYDYLHVHANLRRVRGVAYAPNRATEIWAATSAVLDRRTNRYVLPPGMAPGIEAPG